MLDNLTGRALLEAIGALAANPHPQDKRALQRRAPGVYTEHWPKMPHSRPSRWRSSSAPCKHCKPDVPCLKHAKY